MTPIKRLTINITQPQYETLTRLLEKLEVIGYSEVVRRLITDGKNTYLDNYKEVAKQKMATQITDPVQKEMAKLNAQELSANLKKQRFIEKKTELVTSMGGTVDKDGNGVWAAYIEEQGRKIKKYTITRDLEAISDEEPDFLFRSASIHFSKPAKVRESYRELIELPQNKEFKEEIENLLNKLYPNG